ncbi:hypothetical protein Pmani_034544 [Petrolisthes manimaculis]|uniref:Uncharacterized protein n=1 Tax=Petrolisthes manimaculis TaxID=1843537 RepID=A0AAE1NM80_9EUCA|nr:hypothetical protein Pmani_034544 [Petrolisthes manimaculis]
MVDLACLTSINYRPRPRQQLETQQHNTITKRKRKKDKKTMRRSCYMFTIPLALAQSGSLIGWKLENRPPTVQEREIYIQRLMAKRIDDALPPLLLKRGRGGSGVEEEGGEFKGNLRGGGSCVEKVDGRGREERSCVEENSGVR